MKTLSDIIFKSWRDVVVKALTGSSKYTYVRFAYLCAASNLEIRDYERPCIDAVYNWLLNPTELNKADCISAYLALDFSSPATLAARCAANESEEELSYYAASTATYALVTYRIDEKKLAKILEDVLNENAL